MAIEIVFLKRGETFFSKFLVPEGIEELASLTRLENGSVRIVALHDLVLVAEGLHTSGRGAKHVRFARLERTGVGEPVFQVELPGADWARPMLRRWAAASRRHASGGWDYAIGYRDEISVADFRVSGSRGWILTREEYMRIASGLAA